MSFFRRLRENVRTRHMPKSDADILFSLSSAHITLELKQGLKVGGRCAVTFKTVSGELFREMEKELKESKAATVGKPSSTKRING